MWINNPNRLILILTVLTAVTTHFANARTGFPKTTRFDTDLHVGVGEVNDNLIVDDTNSSVEMSYIPANATLLPTTTVGNSDTDTDTERLIEDYKSIIAEVLREAYEEEVSGDLGDLGVEEGAGHLGSEVLEEGIAGE